MERSDPKTAQPLADTKGDLLASNRFPRARWRQVWPTNPLGLLIREILGSTDVVGASPNREALLGLTAVLSIERIDQWAAANRGYWAEGRLISLNQPEDVDEEETRQPKVA